MSDEIGGIIIKTGKYKKVGLDTITRISIVEWGRFAKRERGKMVCCVKKRSKEIGMELLRFPLDFCVGCFGRSTLPITVSLKGPEFQT